MEVACPPALALVPADVSPAPVLPASAQTVRMPEAVYRRRRLAVAMIALLVLTLAVVAARPDRVPPGEANPWPSTGDASLPADLPGVYVVQPGDTLWDIALAIAPGADPRALVHELAEAAGGAALEPGQKVVIGAGSAMPVASDPQRHPDQPADAAGADPFAT